MVTVTLAQRLENGILVFAVHQFSRGCTMESLPQPHGATCTEWQCCTTVHGWGREIYLTGAMWCNACTEQALIDQGIDIVVLQEPSFRKDDCIQGLDPAIFINSQEAPEENKSNHTYEWCKGVHSLMPDLGCF